MPYEKEKWVDQSLLKQQKFYKIIDIISHGHTIYWHWGGASLFGWTPVADCQPDWVGADNIFKH